MDPIAAAILSSWSSEPGLVAALLVTSGVYLRGFGQIRSQAPAHFPAWRRTAFLAGISALLLALASPLDAFADLLLQVHMAQHWLLMMVAPPLLWLGAPTVPLMRGLPRRWLRRGIGPFLAWPALQRTVDRLTHPVFAGLAWALTTLVWHWPPAYQLALRARFWHDAEHVSFLAVSLLFWHAVIAPWPSRRHGSRLGSVLLLALAALFNTVFSASFAFSTRVFYPAYLAAPNLWGFDALSDQNAAGGLLWVAASLPMLIAATVLIVSELEPQTARPSGVHSHESRTNPRSRSILRAFATSFTLRRALQWTLLILAAAIVVDGLLGPQRPSALNLAGVLPWTYWRGWLVIGLLVVGNVFCAVCPFTLSRRLAARWLGQPYPWPAALSGKWPAFALFAGYLWAYETFALWDSPWWTAWIIIGYFAACFLIEGLFPRGRFCRHICPIGQFQFVHAGVSPLEVQTTDSKICEQCTSHDCLRGNDERPGCPTELFVPAKEGNLDCTFCLDCVRACPHDNIRLATRATGTTIGRGRPPRPERGAGLDVAALALVFSFGAFANAAAMTAPFAAWLGAGGESALLRPAFALATMLLVFPALAAFACAWLSARGVADPPPLREMIRRFAPSLIPTSLAMWTAHFGFHLIAGIATLGPASGRAAPWLGVEAVWTLLLSGAGPSHATLTGLQIAALGIGLIASTAVAWRIALEDAPATPMALRLATPWVVLCTLLYGLGVWIVLQPMEMRGMVMT